MQTPLLLTYGILENLPANILFACKCVPPFQDIQTPHRLGRQLNIDLVGLGLSQCNCTNALFLEKRRENHTVSRADFHNILRLPQLCKTVNKIIHSKVVMQTSPVLTPF